MKLFFATGYTVFVDEDTGEIADYIEVGKEDKTLILAPNKELANKLTLYFRYVTEAEETDVRSLKEMNSCYRIYIGKGFSRPELEEIVENLPETLKGKIKLKLKKS